MSSNLKECKTLILRTSCIREIYSPSHKSLLMAIVRGSRRQAESSWCSTARTVRLSMRARWVREAIITTITIRLRASLAVCALNPIQRGRPKVLLYLIKQQGLTRLLKCKWHMATLTNSKKLRLLVTLAIDLARSKASTKRISPRTNSLCKIWEVKLHLSVAKPFKKYITQATIRYLILACSKISVRQQWMQWKMGPATTSNSSSKALETSQTRLTHLKMSLTA